MNSVRLAGTDSLRRLSQSPINSLRSREKGRTLSHVSQPMLKMEQGAVSSGESSAKTSHWVFPAALALLGLSFSTFCTHQLVSDNTSQSSFKAFSPKYIKYTTDKTGDSRNSDSSRGN